MCGRYSIGKTGTQLAAELEATLAIPPEEQRARYNVAPSQGAPMLIAVADHGGVERRLGLAQFGWRLDRKKGLLLNARSETAAGNGLFRSALERRRSLIPADGFYEWRVRPPELGEGKKPVRDAFFLHEGGSLLTFAGLYYVERVEGQVEAPSPAKKASFVILTTAASEDVQRVHDRMPIIVPASMRSRWLDTKEPVEPLLDELSRLHPPLSLRAVGAKVGSPANDDPSLHDPISAVSAR